MSSEPPPSTEGLGLTSSRRADPGRLIRGLGRAQIPTRVLVAAVIAVWVVAALLLVWTVATAAGPALEPVPVR